MKKDNHYFAWGLTAVAVVCTLMLIYDLVFRDSIVMAYAGMLADILAPVLYGAAMAYLLAPIVNWFERSVLRRQGRTPSKWRRTISVTLTWVVVLALLYGLLSVLLPELYASVKQLVGNAQRYYNTIYNWVIHMLESNPDDYMNDLRFHDALAIASHNMMLAATIHLVNSMIADIRVRFFGRPDYQRRSQESHIAIYEAVRDRDEERAKREMDLHLKIVEDFARKYPDH